MFLAAGLSSAQTTSGQISGVVADPAGAVISGLPVRLTSDLNGQPREYTTATDGSFVFTGLVPGNYSLHIAKPGFRASDHVGINVSAQERVDLHEIRLAVGDVNTSVSVTAEVAHVATDSSDRAIAVNERQIEDTPMAGRNYLSILRSLPGTQAVNTTDTRGWGQGGPGVNGSPGQLLVTLDGIASQDSGAPGTGGYIAPSVDAIAEVKVLVSNYTAEYGARGGGQMNVTIKNGTNRYHGTLYHYYRNEWMNANEWFNSRNLVTVNGIPVATPKARYRYQNPGGTIGGPLLIPGTRFNRSHSKLFFFFSEDYLHNLQTNGPNRYTMPTAAERGGDYSQTVTSTGVQIPIKNPLAGGAPFSGNLIPASRVSPVGAAMMNLFPVPGVNNLAFDITGARGYNTQFQWTRLEPREDRILRLDYNVAKKTTSSLRLIQDYQGSDGPGAILGPAGAGWGQTTGFGYDISSAGVASTVIHTFRPNLINEFTWGINRAHQIVGITDQAQYNAALLPALKTPAGQAVTLPNFFGANNLNLIPNINFGTTGAQAAGQVVTGAAPSFGWDSRWPFNGTDEIDSLTNTLTWVRKKHSVKFGFYFEHDSRNVSVYSTYNTAGTYWFGSDTSNPNDTGYAFSNMLTGAVQAYGEDNVKQVNHARYKQIEWFAQDTWKLSRRLTADIGLRFVSAGPVYSPGATLGIFNAAAYNTARAGQVLYPACAVAVAAGSVCPAGSAVAKNPVTGATYAQSLSTAFDPASFPANGNPFSGMAQYQTSFFHTPPIQLAPRIGLAWDVLGHGKLALRTGFGIFYDRAFGVDTIGATGSGTGPMAAPPYFRAPIYYNTTFNNLLATQGLLVPQNVNGGSPDYQPPSVYNWSFGVQQDLGRQMILDVGYVGNVHHHGFGTATDGNAVAPYTDWKPTVGAGTTTSGQVLRFLDPTSTNGGTGAFYSANLIRALAGSFPGYGAISEFTSIGEGYYDALQVQLNRRVGKRLQFGSNYTWQKTITYNHNQWLPDVLTKNVANRKQALNLNFGWKFSAGNAKTPKVARVLLRGWNLNGVGAIFSGLPMTVNCSVINAPIGYWYGTPTGAPPLRCQMNGPMWLPAGSTQTSPGSVATTSDTRLWTPLNAASFALPAANSFGIGNTPLTLAYGPGFWNFDLSMYKEFRLGRSETRVLQFRAETFDFFNHFNPANPNSTLTYNFATGAQTNASFGTITGAQNNARRMSISLRLKF